ncbi:MAG: 3-oxoadipyl-CoA thiolase [Pseudomonadota bacterium]|uniref:3-oxoadipyl-CoA thiolase n=1 Tax=Rhizorhabdus phycosphaerae TaxID=2711156 RepID=UPI0013EC50AD|nr:3-oxoadipyl-CoA thiolase [Rhizorhabdus phycosphaerae]
MKPVFLCDGIRTPIGRHGGALATVRPDDLAARTISALLARHPGLPAEAIDEVLLGCANQAGEDNRNVARMAALLAGMPVSVPGATVNRLCASGLDAVGSAARAIACGEAGVVIAGGVESMSRAPFVMGKAPAAFSRGQTLEDTTIGWRFVNPTMRALHGVDSMPETAENLAEQMRIGRADQDGFAWRSQMRAAVAEHFRSGEILPIEVGAGKTRRIVDRDEHPRETTLETLASLKPIVRPDGTITAGNASGVNDGAAALLLAGAEAVERHGLQPRARILGMATAGVEPRIMGIGPVPATLKLLERIGWTLGDVDLVELNEAFAAQALAVMRGLGLPDDAAHVNPHGGAIALGHPLGMSGARLALTALRGLEDMGGRRAMVSLCVGVGQGVSLALERI